MSCKKIKKVRVVYISPYCRPVLVPPIFFYQIWHTRSTHRRNHGCQIFSRSVQGLRSSDTPKLPFPIDLLRRPYNNVALPCDTDIYTE